LVDGYGNPEGDWYQANSTVAKGFGQITALSNSTTLTILLRSGDPTVFQNDTLIIDFDNVVLKAVVPTSATVVAVPSCTPSSLANGDFESDLGGNSVGAPWQFKQGDSSCTVTDVAGFNGSKYASKVGCTGVNGTYGSITQTLTSCAGAIYDLNYYYRVQTGGSAGSFVSIMVFDTNDNSYLYSGTLSLDDPTKDGNGNAYGSWYPFSLASGVTTKSNSTTVAFVLQMSDAGVAPAVVDFDNVVFVPRPTTTTTAAQGYPTVTGTITGTQQPSSVPSKQGVSLVAVATARVTGLLPWLNA